MTLPRVWNEPLTGQISGQLRAEAERLFRVHQLPKAKDDWLKLREELRSQLWNAMGVSYDSAIPLDVQVTKTIPCDGYKILCLHYQSRPGIRVTGNLYVPDGKGPFPAVINVHGHWAQGRLAERVQSRGHSLAKNGYVCLAVDAWGSGERCTEHGVYTYHGSAVGSSLLLLGETLLGAQVVDNMRGVQLLTELPYVQADKIGATGASGGGNQTMWLTAMDDRIQAAMPVVSVGTFASYVMRSNCICELLPGGLTFTEEPGVLALAAPRALKICNCLRDSNPTFFVSEMLRSFNEARKVFQALDADDKFSYQAFDLPHGFWPEVREAMLGFFDLHLKGIGHGQPRRELPFTCLPEEEVMVFPKGERPETITTIVDYCREQGKRHLAEPMPDQDDIKFADYYLEGRLNPPLLELDDDHYHRHDDEDGWQRWSVPSFIYGGRLIPVLYRPPANKSDTVVILSSPTGKNGLENSALLSTVLAEGNGVLLFDAYGTGEAPSDNESISHTPFHTLSRGLLWLGRTLMGEWCGEFGLMAEFARLCLDAHKVTFGGTGDMAVAACCAAALGLTASCEMTEVMVEDMPETLTWQDGPDGTVAKRTMASFIPDFVEWGDIRKVKAILKNDNITIRTVTA
ncbi:MAG: Cephalosporin-C deacetylase [Lentisphaerae bacterium ADurb.Bin082]|nr:MAG: Cephalosporin-C deacetylase [Lentisphaerae bacterium ADurb.Bin082]